MNDVNQAEKGWRSISSRGSSECQGPVTRGGCGTAHGNERWPMGWGGGRRGPGGEQCCPVLVISRRHLVLPFPALRRSLHVLGRRNFPSLSPVPGDVVSAFLFEKSIVPLTGIGVQADSPPTRVPTFFLVHTDLRVPRIWSAGCLLGCVATPFLPLVGAWWLSHQHCQSAV